VLADSQILGPLGGVPFRENSRQPVSGERGFRPTRLALSTKLRRRGLAGLRASERSRSNRASSEVHDDGLSRFQLGCDELKTPPAATLVTCVEKLSGGACRNALLRGGGL